jgi:hypothetical protein
MFEIFACVTAVVVFAAVWLAVYKLGGLDWTADLSLAEAGEQLTAANLVFDGEVHGAAARLSPVARKASAPTRPLFDTLAGQARLTVPV